MTSRHVGDKLQNTFFVDRDDIRHHSRSAGSSNAVHISWISATQAGYEKLVAPNSLVTSYAETVVSSLIGLPLPGRVSEERIRFAKPVYASDRVVVEACVSTWNAQSGVMHVSVSICKEEGGEPVLSGMFMLDLAN
jgi:acyl dehydratase